MNLRRIVATFIKEAILAARDKMGLLMLFIMPLAMIIIMAIVQDIPFRDYQDVGFKILWLDEDRKSVGDSMHAYVNAIKNFNLIDSLDGRPLDRTSIENAINRGDYAVGVIIPRGITAFIGNKINGLVNEIGKSSGQPSIYPYQDSMERIQVELIFDPAAKNTYRVALKQAIDKLMFRLQYDLLIKRLGRTNPDSNNPSELTRFSPDDNVHLVSADNEERHGIINSVQHNVPAWIVFAIFFLILPLSGNYIKEQEAGSKIRIAMTPGSPMDIALGKVFFYMLLGVAQFSILMSASQLLLPLFGLPLLVIGNHWFILLMAAVIITFPAISLGFFIGTIFTTHSQATMFGSILIIILSAVGGIWIPIEVLPNWMQLLAKVSPLQWSLKLINDIMLRDLSASKLFITSSILVSFGLVFLFLARLMSRRTIRQL